MAITDAWINPPSTTIQVTALGWREELDEFAHEIYSFFLSSIRDLDQKSAQLLYRWILGAQREWEVIYSKILALPDLYSPDNAPEWALEYLKDNVGIDDDLEYLWGTLSTNEKRRLIRSFVRFVMLRCTSAGYDDMLESMTGQSVYITEYFFFRWLLSGDLASETETALGREDLGYDPWLLHEYEAPVGVIPNEVSVILDAGDPDHYRFKVNDLVSSMTDPPAPNRVRITYRPTRNSIVGNMWTDGSDWYVDSESGYFFGQDAAPYVFIVDQFRVGFEPDEYVFDIRIIDDGTLNRDMVEALVRFGKPMSERIYVRYYSMIEEFKSLDLWATSGTATLDEDNERVTISGGSSIETNVDGDDDWAEYNVSVQAYNSVVEKYFEIRLMKQDDDNYIYLRVTPATPPTIPAGTWAFGYVESGADNPVDSGNLDWFDVDVNYFWRIVAVLSSGNLVVQGYQDEIILFNQSFSDPWNSASGAKGKVELVAEAGGETVVTYCDVHPFPMESDYIGV